jgi:hypothetical protein
VVEKKVNWTIPAGRQLISKSLGSVLAEATKFFAFRDSVEKAQPSKIMIHRGLDELIWISWDDRKHQKKICTNSEIINHYAIRDRKPGQYFNKVLI